MRVLAIIFLSLFSTITFSQEYDYPDNSDTEVGFNLGVNHSIINLKNNLQLVNDTIKEINSKNLNGFNISMIFYFNTSKHTAIKTTPGLYFQKNEIDFMYISKGKHTEKLYLSSVNFPVQLNYYPSESKNIYIFGGFRYQILLGNSDNSTEHTLELRKNNFSLEAGLGFDFRGKSLIFSPEIKYSYGILNIKKPADNIYNNSLSEINFHSITFSLNFM